MLSLSYGYEAVQQQHGAIAVIRYKSNLGTSLVKKKLMSVTSTFLLASSMLFFKHKRLCSEEQGWLDLWNVWTRKFLLNSRACPPSVDLLFLPADTTITRRVAATIEVSSSVVHRKEYQCLHSESN